MKVVELELVDNRIYCDFHCDIHGDVVDYYTEGFEDECSPCNWRPVFVEPWPRVTP